MSSPSNQHHQKPENGIAGAPDETQGIGALAGNDIGKDSGEERNRKEEDILAPQHQRLATKDGATLIHTAHNIEEYAIVVTNLKEVGT